MLFKNSIARLSTTGFLTALALPAIGVAATVSVGGVSDHIATPVGKPGFSYVANSDGTTTLSVYTDGYVFCDNTGVPNPDLPTKLQMKHQLIDTGPTPVHEWAMPIEQDVASVSYRGGNLAINSGFDNSLTCLAAAADGAIPTAFAEGVFDNGLDPAAETNYRHLLNFAAPPGFDFSNPDFGLVPTDPCADSANQPPLFVENVACAAVTGARLGAGNSDVRDAKLWTYTDGSSFVYLVRVDGHFGRATQTPASQRQPTLQDPAAPDGSTTTLYVQDAFDGTYLSSQAGVGQYCTLTEFPAVLNTSVCSGQVTQPLSNGNFKEGFSLGTDGASFYVAVIRPVIGTHQNPAKPVVAVSASFDGAISIEGGDNFIGDNIVFGFMPGSSGFPWMSGGQ